MSASARAWHDVPRPLFALLGLALAAQLAWHARLPPPEARAEALPAPPSESVARALALGEPAVFAKLGMLWLQAFDTQPGVSLPLRALDYGRVIDWLALLLALDPEGQYPLLAASRFYAEVPAPAKQRQMLEFVDRTFREDPDRRWPWLAHAVFVARHRLHDQTLALRYAEDLARYATGPAVPDWARQMRIFVLADMGEVEAAKVLLGGLLASGRLADPNERHFLMQRLEALEAATAKDAAPSP
ncbi:MAG: hypothetical protein HY749_14245 [Gammaproteobacteria bacterium]|nr:hypothetical protein [Gammaproteobacteria bacterium]